MEEIVRLLTGVLVAAAIFAAVLFSAAQAFRQDPPLSWAHLASAALSIAAMAALSLGLWAVAQGIGAALVFAAIAAVWHERGWNRLLPLVQLGFGAALLAGLPVGR